MGFGLLFIGYFFLLFFPLDSIDVMPNIAVVGCIVMLYGLKRLIHYCPSCRGFVYSKYTLIPLSALSIACLALNAAEYDRELSETLEAILTAPIGILSEASIGLLGIFIMLGIYRLAGEVELPKLQRGAARRITLCAVYILFAVFSGAAGIVGAASTDRTVIAVLFYSDFIAFILEYLCLIINLFFIFKCYMQICLEGDEDMPPREDIFDKLIAYFKRNNNKRR